MTDEHPAAPAAPGRPSRRRIALTIASAVLGAGLLAVLMPWATGAGWTEVGTALTTAPAWALLTLTALGVATTAVTATGIHGALPELGCRGATLMAATGGALTIAVPGGAPIAAALLHTAARHRGVGPIDALAGIVLITAAELGAGLLLAPVGALGILLFARGTLGPGASVALILAAALSFAILVMVCLLQRPATLRSLLTGAVSTAERTGAWELLPARARAALHPDRATTLRAASAMRLRRHPLAILGAPLALHALQLGALLAALQATGLATSLGEALGVFALGRLLALVPLTPGGAGLAETGSAAALVQLGADPAAAGASSVLVTVATLLVPVALGAAAAPVVMRRLAEASADARRWR